MNSKLVNLLIELKYLLEKETNLSKKVEALSKTDILLTKDFYLMQKNLYIESGYLTVQKIELVKKICSLGVPIKNVIKDSEDYLEFLLNSLVNLDHEYKKARNIVISQIKSGTIDKECQELSLLDIEFDY